MTSAVVYAPQSIAAPYVVLSFLVSCLGAFTTLVQLRRRTSFSGAYNWILLIGSAVTMGGVAIFCMHFVGNRAITLQGGFDPLSYNPGYTAASFIIPVFTLFLSFVLIGTAEQGAGRWWRFLVGGTTAGAAIVGMHYMGQAAIDNYNVTFEIGYVVGSVVIALVATNAALLLFFVLRSSWSDSWWRIGGCSVFLAVAVTSMHWLAASGTRYSVLDRPTQFHGGGNALVIFVASLSIVTCLFFLGHVGLSYIRLRSRKDRAQKIVLASAIFDPTGHILVTGSDGTLPSHQITDHYDERSLADIFDTANPVFQWLYRVSHDWSVVAPLIPKMRQHIQSVASTNFTKEVTKDDNSLIFREHYCLSAQALADRLHVPIQDVGIVWDKIVKTGSAGRKFNTDSEMATNDGQGQFVFLVKHVTRSEADRYLAQGYRFADINSVSPNIASSLNLPRPETIKKLLDMQNYRPTQCGWSPGVHVASFGIKAGVQGGFSLVVNAAHRFTLPAAPLDLEYVFDDDRDFIRSSAGRTVRELIKSGRYATGFINPAREEFSTKLGQALEALNKKLNEPLFQDATLLPDVVELKCDPQMFPGQTTTLIVFRFSIPIHSRPVPAISSIDFTPFNLFNAAQQTRSEISTAAFRRMIHREFSPIFETLKPEAEKRRTGIMVQSDVQVSVGQAYNDKQEEIVSTETSGGELDSASWVENALVGFGARNRESRM